MFEKIPTPELERVQEQLTGEEFDLSRTLISRELAKRAILENPDQTAILEAIRNDISGIYDGMDDTPPTVEFPEQRWLH